MKVYSVASNVVIKDIVLLMKTNSVCTQLRWSRTIKDLPQNIIGALDTIEQFVEAKIQALCDKELFLLSQEEEELLMKVIRNNPDLKDSLGMGVITEGEQSNKVVQYLEHEKGLERIYKALRNKDNIVIF